MNDIQYVIMYYGFPILGLIITSIAQFFITTSYSKYKKVLSKSNKKGCDVARTILDMYWDKVCGKITALQKKMDAYEPPF